MPEGNSGSEARSALSGAMAELPPSPAGAVLPCQQAWVEVQMLDETRAPVPALECEVVGPNGEVHHGVTDENGIFRVDGVPPGSCQISFPALDGKVWKKA
jgi:hypothetical protein